MKKEHKFKYGTRVVATDEHYWLKPGQVSYDVLFPYGKALAAEQVVSSWADFDKRLALTMASEEEMGL